MSSDVKGAAGCGEGSTCGFIADLFIAVRGVVLVLKISEMSYLKKQGILSDAEWFIIWQERFLAQLFLSILEIVGHSLLVWFFFFPRVPQTPSEATEKWVRK